jgi:hypothetical protein
MNITISEDLAGFSPIDMRFMASIDEAPDDVRVLVGTGSTREEALVDLAQTLEIPRADLDRHFTISDIGVR